MRKLSRILEHVHERPWLITPGGHRAIAELLKHSLEESVPASLWSGDSTGIEGVGYAIDRMGIASLDVSGTLGNRLSLVEKICGGVDYQELEQAVQSSVEDGARGLLLTFDSPGGMGAGCMELAQVLADVPIPKVAFSDSLLCSAAYCLAASCDAIQATPSALVGCIGVMQPWTDQTGLYAKAGLRDDPIVSRDSSLKTTGSGPSLSADQRAYLQAQADQLYEAFTGFVSRYRAIDFAQLQGGVYFGKPALDANLIDRIGTHAEAYATLVQLVDKAA